jgi:antitoxin component YwqK of YwqJK toxin-antitoxin module
MKIFTIMLKALMLFLVLIIAVFNSVIYAQPVQQVVYDTLQYPGYPTKSVLIPDLPTEKDSIPLHLLRTTVSADINSIIFPVVSPYIPPYVNINWGEGYQYWQLPPYVISWNPSWLIVNVMTCGDSYHENGQLSSRVECVDSVFHGKAFFWDETGHKTSESTYFEGHQTKQKSYDNRGRVTHVNHYDFNGAYDGVCIYYEYDSYYKSVSRYEHGVQHGLQEEYRNDKLESKTVYDNGTMIKRSFYYDNEALMNSETFYNGFVLEGIHYYRNGSVSYHEKRNENNEMLFVKRWSESGALTEDRKYLNGKPVGVALIYFDETNGISETEYYEEGVLLSYQKTKGSKTLAQRFYENGALKTQLNFFESGDTGYYAIQNENGIIMFEKLWNEFRAPVKNVQRMVDTTGQVFLTGRGFYMLNDTLYLYSIESENWDQIESRYVIYNSDTIRMDYVVNNSGVASSPIYLSSNTFSQVGGITCKNGEWKYYSNNNLDSVITYKNGAREGRAVYYNSLDDSVAVESYGHYVNDKKEGEWIYFHDPLFVDITTLSESEQWQRNMGKVSVVINYTENNANGKYQFFDASHRLMIEGNYLNGEPDGRWIFYNSIGEITRKVNYKNGESNKRSFS